MKLRTIVVVGGLGVAAIALIGAGAAATFTQDTTSTQKITAGTMNVVLSAPGAQGNNTSNISLPDVGPVASTFATAPTVITITNNGNIPVNEIALKMADTNTSSTLQSEAWACFYSDGEIRVNELLTTVEGYGAATVAGLVAASGGTDTYTMVIYAGSVDMGCGTPFTGFSGGAYTTFRGYTGAAPAFGANPSAASLTNPAQGGSLTPSTTLRHAHAEHEHCSPNIPRRRVTDQVPAEQGEKPSAPEKKQPKDLQDAEILTGLQAQHRNQEQWHQAQNGAGECKANQTAGRKRRRRPH